jgi:hypothetical protein
VMHGAWSVPVVVINLSEQSTRGRAGWRRQ